MKRKPHQPAARPNRRTGAPRRWASRRRMMTDQLLRGACYGAGTGAAGLIVWWIEQRS
ncbi:hypothetical protein [Streptomyces sp. NBC_01789]|uniref:hypothetical protein n=1 Tax=Streptomyces sp. NBC_01789 TaxID=2975941 RepID=UPI00225A7D51|nr:hypothetical protein [Streptomyces sp. NBC_01789]MCX4451563.1 hypothetical protein [Streptomyces sp. NBC_01789]